MRRFYQILLSLVVLAYSYNSVAQVYILDRSFGSCGSAILFLNEAGQPELKQIKVLPDGKILLAGDFFHAASDSISILLVRYGGNGTLDTAGFGTNSVLFSRINLRSYLNGITLQPDGKIIGVGYENNSVLAANEIPAVYRFTEDGKLDSSLHGDGVVAFRFDGVSSGSLYQAIVLSDEKIVAAGLSVRNGGLGTNGIGLMKLKSNGELDSLFGNLAGFPGRSRLDMDSVADPHLFLMNNQLVLPFIRKNNLLDTLWIARMLQNGNIDNSFGTNGILNTGIRSENLSAILQHDGKLLMGGTLNVPGQVRKIQLLRYTDALLPDPSFGISGYVLVPTIGDPGTDNVLYKIIHLANGKILIIGYSVPTATPGLISPFILRLLENGNLDSSFNGTGSMPITSEFLSGWKNIDSTDTTNFLVSRTPNFELLKYVPNTTIFGNTAEADFDYVVEKQQVFFTERCVNGQAFDWDFGDGDFSQQANPAHQYALPGSYLVTLNVSGPWMGQTVTKRVDVRGIYKLTPAVGPDRGFTICRIFGYGFDASSQVVLKKDAVTLAANSVFFDTASQTLQANFQFIGASPGLYDLIVTTGSRSDTLPQSFEIQLTDMGKPWVQIVGPYNRSWNTITGERINTYRLEYGVSGNASQYLIPLGLVISGTDLKANILTTVINRGDTTSLPDSMKPHSSGFYRLYDEITRDSVWRFLGVDNVVEANMTHVLEFNVISTTLQGDFGIRGYIGNSMFDAQQLDTIYSQRTTSGLCSNKCITCAFSLAGLAPGPLGCFASALSTICSVVNFINTPKQHNFAGVFDLAITFASTAVSCITMTGTTFGELLKIVEKTLVGIMLQQPTGLIEDCAQSLINVSTTGSCTGPADEDAGKYKRTGSFDPNIKTGPASYNTNHYINRKEPLIYTTEFENLSTATAPAFQVIVTDTLDKSVVDVSTFRFTGITIANVNYPNFTTKDSFAMDIPMPAKGIMVRVNGKVDTATGVVSWKFVSLDTLTMQLVEDQANGFLPPNIDSISGKGSVSFTVGQKPANAHLTAISIKAPILFDFNRPLIKPVWTNLLDTVKPQSRLLNQFRVLTDSTFSIKWSGTDADAGIRNYMIFISDNDTAYGLKGIFGNDSAVIKGIRGRVYKFISLARDSVDNVEEPPANPNTNPDAVFIFNAALPVKLLSFTAVKENETALLKWSASSEINSSHFIIEHSRNGTTYSGLATVSAAGNSSSQTDYSYKHGQPSKGFNYYRLKIVDRDGKFEYSPVRRLKFDKADAMIVSPNPATNRVTITITEPGGILRLINSTGTILKEIEMTGNQADIDISALSQGLYIITYQAPGNKRWSEKLLIQRGY